MYVIQTLKDLKVLKNAEAIESKYLEEVEKQFLYLYQNLSDNEGQLLSEFNLEDEGYIVILEKGDNLRSLALVGLDANGGLLSATPEFINKIELETMTVFEIAVVYNNEFCMTFYLSKEICDEEVMEWIEENK